MKLRAVLFLMLLGLAAFAGTAPVTVTLDDGPFVIYPDQCQRQILDFDNSSHSVFAAFRRAGGSGTVYQVSGSRTKKLVMAIQALPTFNPAAKADFVFLRDAKTYQQIADALATSTAVYLVEQDEYPTIIDRRADVVQAAYLHDGRDVRHLTRTSLVLNHSTDYVSILVQFFQFKELNEIMVGENLMGSDLMKWAKHDDEMKTVSLGYQGTTYLSEQRSYAEALALFDKTTEKTIAVRIDGTICDLPRSEYRQLRVAHFNRKLAAKNNFGIGSLLHLNMEALTLDQQGKFRAVMKRYWRHTPDFDFATLFPLHFRVENN